MTRAGKKAGASEPSGSKSDGKVDVAEINRCREKIQYLYNDLCGMFLDRDETLKLMMTATVAQEPMLFIGRPGTAKSLLVATFCRAIGLDKHEYFEYMLTKFTEPGEVMGPVDINALKQGKYIRKTAGQLPEARIAFLDEIFKSNSAVLNMLLTIINERKYYQEGTPLPVPLVVLFAASNAIPEFSEFDELNDRFILKVEATPVMESRFYDLIRAGVRFEAERHKQEPYVSECRLDDFIRVHDYIMEHVLPRTASRPDQEIVGSEEMTRSFRTLIGILTDELGVEITDRKLIKLYKLIITQAFLFHGGRVTRDELKLLCYCGNNFKDVRRIKHRLTTVLEHL